MDDTLKLKVKMDGQSIIGSGGPSSSAKRKRKEVEGREKRELWFKIFKAKLRSETGMTKARKSTSLIFTIVGTMLLSFATSGQTKETKMTEKAILAGGCFWGLEELIRTLPGVTDTEVGYTGGDVKNATYENHGTHAEAIKIVFDPTKTSYRALLEFFFQAHDPTTKNRQGNDTGLSYRSAIFYVNEEQKKNAETLIKEIDASQKWPGPVVTQVVPASDFWSAEEYHQNYLQKNLGGYTCHYVRPKWKLK